MENTITRSQAVANDIAALLRARNPLIWCITKEEARVEGYLFEAAAAAGYVPRTWDVGQGVAGLDGKPIQNFSGREEPGSLFELINDRATLKNGGTPERGAWIVRDLAGWLQGLPGLQPMRKLRNLARSLPSTPRESAQAIIVLTPDANVPPELAGHATVIEWPLPDRNEIADILDTAIDSLPEDFKLKAAPNGTRDAAIDAAVGLSGEEAQACYARSLVQHKRIDPLTVTNEKKRVIARERVLEWYDPIPGGLDAVGGLDVLKGWLTARKSAYSPQARAYGLPAPKGALLVGVSGCGKSLTAKAIATAWGVPLLRLDLGALKSKFVGESEGNLRKAFRTIEAVGRCVVWLDELEKSLQGSTSGSSDGGVSSDALGGILQWMQERQGEAFVVATANDISGLPPELLRKGRFDEIFFVDTPNSLERVQVLKAALAAHGRKDVKINLETVATACDGFTGAEIAAIVPDALFVAFADKARELTTADLLAAAKSVVPLTKTASEKIAVLRNWAKERARPATSPLVETTAAPRKGRQVDL